MKRIMLILVIIIAVSGCKSISAEGDHGSFTLRNPDYNSSSKTKKSNGNAYGHNNPNNPHYKN